MDWNGVPVDKFAAWNETFYKSQGGLDLSSACPVCGQRALHRYYLMGRPSPTVRDGRRYAGLGACWEWCSSCRSYVHSTALVPEGWSCDLHVNEAELTAEPEALERAIRARSG